MRVADHARTATSALRSPSMIQSALKILCRQCSEFACANIISSTSVGSRPQRAKLCDQVVDLVVGQREAELGVGALERRAARAPARHGREAAAARACANRPAARRSDRSTRFGHAVVQSAASARSRSGVSAPARVDVVGDAALDAPHGARGRRRARCRWPWSTRARWCRSAARPAATRPRGLPALGRRAVAQQRLEDVGFR